MEENEYPNWIMEAKKLKASELRVYHDPLDDKGVNFPFYCLPDNKEEEHIISLSNTLVEVIKI